jgi:hypothetical protein
MRVENDGKCRGALCSLILYTLPLQRVDMMTSAMGGFGRRGTV